MQKIIIIIENITFEYIIGKSAYENHHIIDESNPYDLWFHVSHHPSCHVICKLEDIRYNTKLFHKIIKQGAIICKQHSNFKNIQNLSISYTHLKNVKKTNIPGEVTLKNVKYINI